MFKRFIFFFLCFCVFSIPCAHKGFCATVVAAQPDDYQEYIKYFQKVYKVVDDNYYQKPDPKLFSEFIKKFTEKIYAQLKGEGKSSDYIRWRSAWYLVDSLKFSHDKFSQFYPPKPAVKFQQEALGQKIDLGIEGKKTDTGFVVTRMEPRSDAFEKGLREDDVIWSIDGKKVKDLTQDVIDAKLTPLVDSKVKLAYFTGGSKKASTMEVISKEYFKQTVFLHAVPVPGVFCLEIPKFNRTTGEDLFRFLKVVEAQHPIGLVLDLRGNPGGPPLAAREISSFFLKGGDEFAYFQMRGDDKEGLDVPSVDPQYQFNGPIVILVDQDSGSASELFAGVMQFRHRAVVLGTNTAGQVMLKSMFPVGDGSMIGLVTGMGHLPDGSVFSWDGVTPDKIILDAPKEGLIDLAAAYIAMQNKNRS